VSSAAATKIRSEEGTFIFAVLKIKACVPGRRFLADFFVAVDKEDSRQKGETAQLNIS